VISKIKNRLAAEQGFTLIELLVVIVILGILVAIAVPSYLSLRGNASKSAAMSNVRSAIPAVEVLYQNATPNSYATLSNANVQLVAPGVAPATKLKAGPNTAGDGYCIQDTEDGTNYALYTGGNGGTSTITYGTTQCPTGATGYTVS
jgi:type IV pilus assembly protein PilA